MNIAQIRKRFTEHYNYIGYKSLPSAPMIDPSIPMSFVMSAGLVQVENSLARSVKHDRDKYVLVQSCFRHFDLEKVGRDDIHLSQFEMPGVFVFGPNRKAETVERMWTLATKVLRIDGTRVWASYFNGGNVIDQYIPEDNATYHAWLDVGIPRNHIVGLGTKYNYWIQSKSFNSPVESSQKCGPNTELFFDRGVDRACGKSCDPSCTCGRFIEFSNSLFIDSELDSSSTLFIPSKNPFTETVIGSERVAMILQRAESVFETSDLAPLVETVHQFICEPKISEEIPVYARVIADHMRALYFLIGDGAPHPGKDGRARIIKILIRRILTRQIVLGISSNTFLPTIIRCISQLAPLNGKAILVGKRLTEYYLSEMERFTKTIERGLHQLSRLLRENANKTLTGSQIVRLEKQWGLPSELIFIELKKKGLEFRSSEYQEALYIADNRVS